MGTLPVRAAGQDVHTHSIVQVQLRGEGERSEEDLEVVELEAPRRTMGPRRMKRRMGPAHPSGMYLTIFLCLSFLFYFHTGMMGSR